MRGLFFFLINLSFSQAQAHRSIRRFLNALGDVLHIVQSSLAPAKKGMAKSRILFQSQFLPAAFRFADGQFNASTNELFSLTAKQLGVWAIYFGPFVYQGLQANDDNRLALLLLRAHQVTVLIAHADTFVGPLQLIATVLRGAISRFNDSVSAITNGRLKFHNHRLLHLVDDLLLYGRFRALWNWQVNLGFVYLASLYVPPPPFFYFFLKKKQKNNPPFVECSPLHNDSDDVNKWYLGRNMAANVD